MRITHLMLQLGFVILITLLSLTHLKSYLLTLFYKRNSYINSSTCVNPSKINIFLKYRRSFKHKVIFINNPYKTQVFDYVTYVIDGDTIVTQCHGKVRLALVDTPETIKEQQDFGVSAKRLTTKFLLHKKIILAIPNMQYPYDKYHRLIAIVFTQQGLNINKLLLQKGLAIYNNYGYISPYNSRMIQAQYYAQQHNLGIWSLK